MDRGGNFVALLPKNQEVWWDFSSVSDFMLDFWKWCVEKCSGASTTLLETSGGRNVDCHSNRLFFSIRTYVFLLCSGDIVAVLEEAGGDWRICCSDADCIFSVVLFRTLSDGHIGRYGVWYRDGVY